MNKLSNKQLKEMGDTLRAYEITYANDAEIQAIKEVEGWLNEIAYSLGMYGTTGLLLQGHNNGKFYIIKSRTSAIYKV